MGYSADVLATSGLVAYYKLDETSGTNAVDSKNGYDGTHTNITVNQTSLLTNEPAGKAILVPRNASVNYVSLPSAVKTSLDGSSAVSIEFWIKPSTLINSAYICTLGDSAGSNIQIINTSAGNLLVSAKANSGELTRTSTALSALSAGTTSHIVGVIDFAGDNIKIYKNGVQVQSTSSSFVASVFTATGTPATRFIGNTFSPGSSTGTPNATIDSFAVYTGALSPATILAHYNAGIAESSEPVSYTVPAYSFPTGISLLAPVQIPATPNSTSTTIAANNPTAKVVAESPAMTAMAMTLYDPIFTPWIKQVSNVISMGLAAYAPLQLPVTPDTETTALELFDPLTNPLLIGAPDSLAASLYNPTYARVDGDVWYYETVVIAKLESVSPAALTLTMNAPVGGGGSNLTGNAYSARIDTTGALVFSDMPITGNTISYMPEITSTIDAEVAGSASTSTIIPATSGSIAFEYLLTGQTQ